MKPNFICIGAQKSGTTWLHKWFSSRDDIFVPEKIKEIMYFDVEDNYKKGFDWYLNFFKKVKDDNLDLPVGEITPGYLWVSKEHPEWGAPSEFRQTVPDRIYNNLGRVKIICILRNPIDRAISAYMHHLNKGRIKRGDTLLDVGHKHGIVHMGFYYSHLKKYVDVFGIENIKIFSYEDFFSDPNLRISVSEFISGRQDDGSELLQNRVNKGLGFLRNDKGILDDLGNSVASKKDLLLLKEIYKKDVLDMRDLLNFDISSWSDFVD